MIQVTKRDGSQEPLNLTKITKALEWAKGDDDRVSISDIEMSANLHFYNGMPTSEIHDILIRTTKDMIDAKRYYLDSVSTHLTIQKIYKEAFGDVKRFSILEIFENNKLYNKEIIKKYTLSEVEELDSYIVDDRDFNFSLAGIEQLVDKYMIVNSKGEATESPQLMFMAISMDAFSDYKGDRIKMVKEFYDLLSKFDISLPTPMMKSLRTTSNDYASCITIRIGDSIDSWTAGKTALMEHTVASAGIGTDISDVASIGDVVKDGAIVHAGKVPLLKAIDADIQATTQNGRRGQGVVYTTFFDPEIEVIMSLKSPRTETAKRINDLKYAIKMNKVWYKRVKEGKDIALFSPRKHKKLLNLFYSKDVDAFEKYYNKLEKKGLADGYINAREYASLFATERTENGIYYIFNVDEANANTCYDEPVTQSNICMEFISVNKEISSKRPNSPDIGVCILSNINQASVGLERLPSVTKALVYMLNEIKGRQVHPTKQANAYVEQYASLGIGFANHAYFNAKNNVKYGERKALELLDEWCEYFQYYLISASADYAKETGIIANKFYKTSYSRGEMPIDRYKKTVDELVSREYSLDWDSLREKVITYGMANCVLSMIPPSETSSVIGNMTSSLEGIKDIITIKSTKGVIMTQLAPEAMKLADKYDYVYSRKDYTSDFIKHLAVVQKWIDMGISGNTFYNPELYEDKKIPEKQILSDLFLLKYYGGKTIYYSNVYVEDEEIVPEACNGGGCSV